MNHRSLSAFLASLTVALALPARAQEPTLSAETFGRASGDTPHVELGLVLELVDPGTSDARLRLFGGIAGHPATIVVSGASAQSVPAPNGAITLVGPAAITESGTFDGHGVFELPLDGIAVLPGQSLYAQGMHAGILDLGGEPLVQLSHGLELCATVEEEQPLWFDDLLPHLPESTDLSGTAGLAERLQRMLNSPGDSVRIAIEVEVTVGLGIEIVDASVGGTLGFEFTVERTEDGLYEVVIAADITALAGVSAGTGAEAGAELNGGYGEARIFRFHSAPGAARGILGMALALRFPELQPGNLLANSGILGEAGALVQELQELVQLAEQHAAELEAFLLDVLDSRVEVAEDARASASARLTTANRNYANAPWHLRPVYWAQVLACRAALAVADARLAVVRAARQQGELAVQAARAVIAAKRAELVAAVRDVARIGRLAASIAQLRGWTTDHYAGSEVRYTTALEVEAQLKLPVVDMKNFGLGTSTEIEQEFITRSELAHGDRPARVTVLQSLQLERKAYGGLGIGGEVACSRKLEVADVYDHAADESTLTGRTLSFSKDTSVVGSIGLIVAEETGVGRVRTFSLSPELAGDLESLFSPSDLVERVGASEVGFELQDRRQKNVDVLFAVDVSGNGGGIEIELEWADTGRRLSRSTTVQEGIERVVHGASEVIDVASGTVLQME